MPKAYDCDVAIIGGGPAGTTTASLLKKYDPSLNVVVLERESFPREHVGESQLPAISLILHEMGVWDKVEAANFPIKVGATYRWGNTKGLWKFDFLLRPFKDEPRPAQFRGQREETAFQVDRAVYDKILLDHAKELGCQVYEQVKVDDIEAQDDWVKRIKFSTQAKEALTGTPLEGCDQLTAKHYVDATGASALIRRKMGVEIDAPTTLRNIAIWDYWQDADWAESVGTGGTRIQVLSLSWGWIWFIPIGPTRTSIGLVMPADRYKALGKKPEEIYLEAVQAEPRIKNLIAKAKRECILSSTNDWSYVANRIVGKNWFLTGDACGFADPILSAGMTLAQTGARRVAYSILELNRGGLDADWIRQEYDTSHREQIQHHIRFADFWYSSNGCFTDLKENCAEIAKHAGLTLNAKEAFRWLSTGGFAGENQSFAMKGTYRFASVKNFTERLTDESLEWNILSKNEFRMNLAGAHLTELAIMQNGRIQPTRCYRRNKNALPLNGMYGVVIGAVNKESDAMRVYQLIKQTLESSRFPNIDEGMFAAYEVLESMIVEGWVTTKFNKKRPVLTFKDRQDAAMEA